jgi:hypothetical protein
MSMYVKIKVEIGDAETITGDKTENGFIVYPLDEAFNIQYAFIPMIQELLQKEYIKYLNFKKEKLKIKEAEPETMPDKYDFYSLEDFAKLTDYNKTSLTVMISNNHQNGSAEIELKRGQYAGKYQCKKDGKSWLVSTERQ